MTAFQFGTLSHQESVTASTNVNTENASITISSDETEDVVVLENPAIFNAKQLSEPTNLESVEKVKKQTFKQRIIQKSFAKKIQKMERVQMSSNMKLGIIIAAVSLLVLIIVAAGLLGGLSGLFWLLGGLGLLTGLLIMLLVALDVI
jgi:sterol desaturase/sphingolipid hydroxylase (fatty acid hydroxylase superfamily)